MDEPRVKDYIHGAILSLETVRDYPITFSGRMNVALMWLQKAISMAEAELPPECLSSPTLQYKIVSNA